MSSPSPPHLDDEALSGLLDGDPAPAGEHLAGCAECRARQAQLADARTLIASPSEGLDEVTRRRLISTAVVAGGPPTLARWYRRPALVGGIAAAAAAVLLAVPVINSLDGDSSDEEPTAASALTAEAAGGERGAAWPTDLGDVGEVTAPALRQRLGHGGTGADTMADSAAEAAPSAPPAAKQEAREERSAAPDEANTYDDRSAGSDRCVTALLAGAAQGGQLQATATGTLIGTPVTVVIVDRGGTALAYVAAQDTCRLVETYTL